MKNILIIIIVACFLLCQCNKNIESRDKIRVFVSILPQEYFAERIGGNRVKVTTLVPPGSSPHIFAPTPKQMASLSRAGIYFRIGAEFEKSFVPKIESLFKNLKIVDTRQGIKMRYMKIPCSHEHHDHREHAETPDPHIWMNPLLVKIQAQTMCSALVNIDPAGALIYRKNCDIFQRDLDTLHAGLKKNLDQLYGRELFVFHPSFGYFADAYGLRQVEVEVDGKEPGARMLSRIVERARQDSVKIIFVQKQFSPKSARAIAESINGAVVSVDPLEKNYILMLEKIAGTIKAALSKIE
ncbi:MAG: zinc ABC transporter substrate-binding protein [bacterium]